MFVKTTKEAKEKLKVKISNLVSFEQRIIDGNEQATLNRLMAIQQDDFSYSADTHIRCSVCGDHKEWEMHPAYTAYANDFDGTIVGCIDCQSIFILDRSDGNLASKQI